jgi:hypothetical protein
MIRRLFTFASALSLVLCIGTAALWVRSYRIWDSFEYWRTRDIELFSNWGELQLYVPTPAGPQDVGEGWEGDETCKAGPYSDSAGRFLGFGRTWVRIEGNDGKAIGREPLYWCPHWALVVVFAVMPAAVIAECVRQRQRFKVGLCQICGYDLRASKDRCPECGRPIARNVRNQGTTAELGDGR